MDYVEEERRGEAERGEGRRSKGGVGTRTRRTPSTAI
jgi:hypothetical protein